MIAAEADPAHCYDPVRDHDALDRKAPVVGRVDPVGAGRHKVAALTFPLVGRQGLEP